MALDTRNNVTDLRLYRRRRSFGSVQGGLRKVAGAIIVFSAVAAFVSTQGGRSIALPVIGDHSAPLAGAVVDARFGLCGMGKRYTCVVDGDTIWFKGEKIRLAGIDAPELFSPECRNEKQLAKRATDRLKSLLNSKSWTLERQGFDRYGRTLAVLRSGGRTAGEYLVREKLAKPYQGRKAHWCS